MNKILFDKSAKKFILNAFDKAIDKEGFVVEKSDPSQRVLTRDAQEVEINRFAGIRKGSEIFIRSDLCSLMQLCDDLSRED